MCTVTTSGGSPLSGTAANRNRNYVQTSQNNLPSIVSLHFTCLINAAFALSRKIVLLPRRINAFSKFTIFVESALEFRCGHTADFFRDVTLSPVATRILSYFHRADLSVLDSFVGVLTL